MTFTQLKIFITVVETGSFTKAGEILNMTQPAVSHAISTLESTLGIKLIIRDRKNGLVLSDIGQRILIHARNSVNSINIIEEEVNSEKNLASGTVRIASFPSASSLFVVDIISELNIIHPNIEVVLLEGNYNEVEEMLRTRVVDIAIIVDFNQEFDSISLFNDPMLVTMPREHPLSEFEKVPIEALENEMFFALDGCGIFQNIIKKMKSKPTRIIPAINTSTVLKMIEKNMGISIIGKTALPTDLSKFQVRELDPMYCRAISVASLNFKEVSPATQLFIKMLLDKFNMK